MAVKAPNPLTATKEQTIVNRPTTNPRQPPPTRAIRPCAAVAVFGACLALAACGGSSSGSKGSAGASTSGSKQESERLKFTQCMREHGVNLPDKDISGSNALQGVPQSTLQAALSACGKYRAGAFTSGSSPSQENDLREGFINYARCLRSNGLNVPEPTGTSIGALVTFRQAITQLESNPAFQKANGKCRTALPKGH
jgi:hypothetical protein